MAWYLALIAVIAVERLADLVVSKRNLAWTTARGGTEYGLGHYPAMVALHVALLVGCVLEPILLDRPFLPALGWPMLAVVLAAQVLRWWCITRRSIVRPWSGRRCTRSPWCCSLQFWL